MTVEKTIKRYGLHTVCLEAACPNRMECFNKQTATFLILGDTCTRNCRFCNVTGGVPSPPDPEEPGNIAAAIGELGLKHAVITSVTRDDLPDGGAAHFAETIRRIRNSHPEIVIEVLIPDFKGDPQALATVIKDAPDIINHNVETVPRLYPVVRPMAVYNRSLELLSRVKDYLKQNPGSSGKKELFTKSGIMVGLGEEKSEVHAVLRDLRARDCDIVTIGQYLAPSSKHQPVQDYIKPEAFLEYETIARDLGFKSVAAAPFVRSSYNAEQFFPG